MKKKSLNWHTLYKGVNQDVNVITHDFVKQSILFQRRNMISFLTLSSSSQTKAPRKFHRIERKKMTQIYGVTFTKIMSTHDI